MASYHSSYAPDEASLFDEQMSLTPSFSTSVDANAGGADLSTPMLDATPYGAGPSNGHHGVGAFVDPATGMYRPPSTDGLYSSYQPTSLPAYSGVVAPFSQVYQDQRHLSPFGQFPPIPTASTSASGSSGLSPAAAHAYPANFTTAPSVLAVQGMVHQQSRVQQHPGFLDPRQQVALLQQENDQAAGISLATITPSQVESFSIASTPSTSVSPPPSSSSATTRAGKPSGTTARKVSGSADSTTAKKPSALTASSAARTKRPPSASPAPSAYDPQEWLSLLPTIRSNLTQKRLQTAALSTAPKLLKDLRLFSHEGSADSPWGDASDVPPEGRAEVLHSLLQYAKEEFWRVFLDIGKQASVKGKGKSQNGGDDLDDSLRSDALDLLQAWLEGASKSIVREKAQAGPTTEKDRKRKELEQATLAYVLKALAKLPLTYEHLISYKKVAKRVKIISDRAPEGAVRAAATQLVTKWSKVQAAKVAETKNGSSAGAASATATKRKADTPDVPAKKAKTAPPPVKKPTPIPAAPKVALPKFQKAPAPAEPPKPAFMAALAGLQKPAAGGSSSSADDSAATKATAAKASVVVKKKKKKVTWPKDDADLCKYRMIEAREVPDSDAEEICSENHHLMDLQEGQSLLQHFEEEVDMEAEIDWYTPIDVDIPETDDFAALREPKQSVEVGVQTEREANTMEVEVDSSVESPGESLVTEEEIVDDTSIKEIALHTSLADDGGIRLIIAQAQLSQADPSLPASNDQITALLGQLTTNGFAQTVEANEAVLPAQLNPHQAPYGAGPQAQPSTNEIDAATLDALKQYNAADIAAIIQNVPSFQGLDLSAIGVAPPSAPYPAAPHQGPIHDQPYNGYVPPAPQGGPPQGWAPYPGQQPGMGMYNGYQPPPQLGPPVPNFHPQHRAPRPHNPAKEKTVQCKFFRMPKGCDWGDRCRFLHG